MSMPTILPAIRSHVGDWFFYVTSLTFQFVNDNIKAPNEVHDRKKLSDWIQREAIETHSESIAKYIQENEQRFLGALIIGVYNGRPDWAPLKIKYAVNSLGATEDQQKNLDGKLGLLSLSGGERLFAIDGQHRVAGIKLALMDLSAESTLGEEEISAIFVTHDASSVSGQQRTRRLFTTVNKKAKRVSNSANIALDEDNGFAVITRQLIDTHWLFEDKRKHISYTSTGSINANDEMAITSVVGLYEIIKDLFPTSGKTKFETERPSDAEIDKHFTICLKFIDLLIEKVQEFKNVFVNKKCSANNYRRESSNHALFRPIGQRMFARSVQLLIARGKSIEVSFDVLLKTTMSLSDKSWNYILWDPINRTMITNKLVIAETQLLTLSGQTPRNNQCKIKLDQLLRSIQTENY
ncbi:MAG: hypothetical protein A2075_23890 [Geobacteraceae bacterium GWC2_58_44]|nr:MAG: hypothetical protein A2075_23890 [Geobacteraceae bacterium GWC2_58_44]